MIEPNNKKIRFPVALCRICVYCSFFREIVVFIRNKSKLTVFINLFYCISLSIRLIPLVIVIDVVVAVSFRRKCAHLLNSMWWVFLEPFQYSLSHGLELKWNIAFVLPAFVEFGLASFRVVLFPLITNKNSTTQPLFLWQSHHQVSFNFDRIR